MRVYYADEDLWKAEEFGLLVDLPETICVLAKVNSTNMSDDESDISESQMNATASDDVRDLKRRIEEVEKAKAQVDEKNRRVEEENRQLKKQSEKRQKRAPKKTPKGEDFKHLGVIKLQDRLNESSMYVVGKSIRTHLFKNMKYFVEVYKDSALQHAFRLLNFDENDKKKYSDYVLYYIDKKITEHRNNAIHKLKRVVLGLDGGKSRQMNVASIRRYTSLTEVNVVCWV